MWPILVAKLLPSFIQFVFLHWGPPTSTWFPTCRDRQSNLSPAQMECRPGEYPPPTSRLQTSSLKGRVGPSSSFLAVQLAGMCFGNRTYSFWKPGVQLPWEASQEMWSSCAHCRIHQGMCVCLFINLYCVPTVPSPVLGTVQYTLV